MYYTMMTDTMLCEPRAIGRAADTIRDGGVVVFPTDTVYGVGCDPYNVDAVRRIYTIKGRKASNPMPVLVSSIDVASGIGNISPDARNLASKYWPGPLTLVVEVTDDALAASLGLAGSVAVRVPGGRCISTLLDMCRIIVGTSANRSGEPSPLRADDVTIECDVLLDDGVASCGFESTIIDARPRGGMRVIRHGALEVQA